MPKPDQVDTRVTVETPEGVDFQFVIAGPGKRGMSFALDVLIKVGVIALAAIFVSLVSEIQDTISGVGAGFFLLAWFAMSWLYGSCCEAFWHGQTIGKRAQHLRVVRTNGTPIGWFEAFGRNLLLPADGMLVLGPIAFNTVGLISMLANRRMQRIGDLVFDTMVIDESREYISRSPEVTMGVEPLKRSECAGRFHVPERTLAVIERLFEGDRLISDGRKEEIARPVAEALRERLGYEEEGPDPTNPNTYFAQQGNRHATFLRQVLKTFADDESDDTAASTSATRRTGTTQTNRSLAHSSSSEDVEVFDLDEILEEDEAVAQSAGLPADWRQK